MMGKDRGRIGEMDKGKKKEGQGSRNQKNLVKQDTIIIQ